MRAVFVLIALLAVMPCIGLAQNVNTTYIQNHTIELYKQYNVSVLFENVGTLPVEIGIGTPDTWLAVNESHFVINVTNATRMHEITVQILADTDLGSFTRNVPYSLAWQGGSSDSQLTFNLHTIEPQTVLDVVVWTDSFEIPIFQERTGVMRVANNGTITAFNVTISDNYGWITYEKNNFSLAINESKVVEFDISPNLTHTGDTNKTHNITITVQSSNSPKYDRIVHVHIPYFDFGNLTCDFFYEQQEMFRLKKEFCDAHPTASDCLTSPVPLEINKTVYVKEPCNLENLTQEDMNAYGVCRSDLNKTQNQLLVCQANLTATLLGVEQTGEKTLRTAEGSWGQSTGFTILLVLVVIGLSIYGVLWLIGRVKG